MRDQVGGCPGDSLTQVLLLGEGTKDIHDQIKGFELDDVCLLCFVYLLFYLLLFGLMIAFRKNLSNNKNFKDT